MTRVEGEPARRLEWWVNPRIMLPIIGVVIVVAALVAPQPTSGRSGDARLSTHLSGSLGARLLYESASRLGWRVVRRDSIPVPPPATGTTIHAVLAPVMPVSPREAHAYLEAVRAGDALLIVLDARDALSDSLGVRHAAGRVLQTVPGDTVGCGGRIELIPPLWADGRVHLWSIRWMRGAPSDRVVFARQIPERGVRRDPETLEAAAGFALGRGRVVVISDPDLLRNDVIRRCAWGADVRVVRMLEWLRDGGTAPRTTIMFDEFHQGFGRRPSMFAVSREFLVGHPVGRTILQLTLAGLVLLLAAAPRALPPTDALRVERRDPLEQIDALAHAYEHVGATRTVAARLLHGVRVRAERGWSAHRAMSNDEFLADVEASSPAVAGDVALVRRALAHPLPDAELVELGAALHRIELSLTPLPSA